MFYFVCSVCVCVCLSTVLPRFHLYVIACVLFHTFFRIRFLYLFLKFCTHADTHVHECLCVCLSTHSHVFDVLTTVLFYLDCDHSTTNKIHYYLIYLLDLSKNKPKISFRGHFIIIAVIVLIRFSFFCFSL